MEPSKISSVKVRQNASYLVDYDTGLSYTPFNVKYDKENEYLFFVPGEKLPNDIDLVHFPYFEPFFLLVHQFLDLSKIKL